MTSSKETKTILFTSCSPKEGKSWIATNVATSFAEIDKRVLLIDGDMRSGKISKIFKLDNVDGLSNYLYYMTGNVKKDVELAKTFIKETKVPNLHILASGTLPPNPSDLIDSDNMKELLAILKNIYDIIIIDAPPCKVVTDSIILSTIVDSTVLVLSANQTKVNDLTEVKKSIKTVGGEIIGTILNRVEVKPKAYSSSYYYTNGNGKSNKEVKNKRIITVEETVELAKIALKRKDYDISKEMVSNAIENKEQELDGVKEIKDSSTSLEITDNLLHMYEIIEKQNRKLNQVIDSISSIKTQLNTEENIEEQLRQEQEQNKRLEQEINKMMLK